ncbi:oxidoreductase [Desulfosporosinus fructosivorans]
MKKFAHLCSPIKVGNIIYKNRIESAPTLFSTIGIDGGLPLGFKLPVDRVFRMMEDRAKGGAASVVLGETPVNSQESKRLPFDPDIDFSNLNDPTFPVFKRYADIIKKHNSLAIAELSHFGLVKHTWPNSPNPLGPVSFTRKDGAQVIAFDKESMAKVCKDFADSAAFMQVAGFDGVFIHCGHGWLFGQFLSPSTNLRTDEYGGSLENRARFPIEILKAIRERVGPDYLIEIRVSGEDHMKDGIRIEETVQFCKMVEDIVDLIHVSSGHYFSPARTHEFSTMFDDHGLNMDNAAAIKKAVKIPVAAVGGINSPELAEKIIAEGKADIVSLGRQMFADPDFAKKAESGNDDEIRSCLRCCKCYPGPLGEHETEPPYPPGYLPPLGSCTINPYNVWPASFHEVYPEDMPVPTGSRKVLIVGGGPAGMQAAITAADRGHKVILADKNDRLGGLLNFTDTDAFKTDLYNFKELLIRQVNKRDIDVRLNTEIVPEMLKEIRPDALIVAVGSVPAIPPITGIDKATRALDTYFEPKDKLGKKVIMIGGGLVGCETALDLVEKGCEVLIVEKLGYLAAEIVGIYRTSLLDNMDKLGIKSIVNANCKEISENSITIENENGKQEFIDADTVIYALGMEACSEVAKALHDAADDIPVFEIGDCVRAARVGEAIDEGYMAAMKII